MYHEYPYTTYFHDIDKMCNACKKLGYRLEVSGDYLKLIDKFGNVVSAVQISYAEKALTDVDGNPIRAYIMSASTGETTISFQHGDGSVTTLTIPFATKAKEDVYGVDLTSYLKTVQISGDKVHFTNGDGTSYELTMPYAIKASQDENGKQIDTYAATLAVDGDNIVLRDSLNRELARITAPYALKALGDADGDTITTTYAHELTAGTTTVILKNKDGGTLSEITVPYATTALKDTDGNAFLSDYAERIVVDGDGKRIGLEAHDGTRLATITVPFATLSTDATNAVEQIAVVGDQIVFTTFGGQSYNITAPYAIKAQKDDNGNTIKNTYIANVTNDPNTGELKFYDATGALLATLQPTTYAATRDDYNNLIADYIKSIVVDNQSNYVICTHGTGDTDSLIINYANRAWKDTLDHPIQNYYVSWLTCEEDVNDGHYKLVMWNGDVPRAEIGRLEIYAYAAQCDVNGKNITTYVANVEVLNGAITVVDGEGNTLNEITGEVDLSSLSASFAGDALTPSGTCSGTAVTLTAGTAPSKAADTFVAPSCTYDSTTQTLTFSAGSFTEGAFSAGTYPAIDTVTDPTFAGNSVTPTGTVTITGGTVAVDFDD